MKSLFSILGLSFLSLTLTNCSLSPEQIASRIEPSKELRETELRAKEERAVELQRQLEEEKRQREEAERRERELEAERQRQKKNEVSLVSAKEVDYRKLRDLLAAGRWKEADRETERVILKAARMESEGYLRLSDSHRFSCQDLRTIDKLWVKYSNGNFGFSVQTEIYQSLGGTGNYYANDSGAWVKFADKVGWRKGGEWLYYSQLTFSIEHYRGHLPRTRVLKEDAPAYSFFERAMECNI